MFSRIQTPFALKQLLFVLWICTCAPQLTLGQGTPDWEVDESAFDASMSVVAAVFIDAERPAYGDHQLAAGIVQGDGSFEVRGLAQPTLINNALLYFLTIYGNETGQQTLTYQFFDPASGSPPNTLTQSTDFAPDAVIGSIGQPLMLHDNAGAGNKPVRTVDPAAFSSSMQLMVSLYHQGEPSQHPQDQIAVCSESCSATTIHAVASPVLINGKLLFPLTIFAETGINAPVFEVFHATSNTTTTVDASFNFDADASIGSIQAPVTINANPVRSSPLTFTLDPGQFESSMSILGNLFIDGVSQTNIETFVGAFVNDELRGFAEPIEVNGSLQYFLTAYGQTSDRLSFKAFMPTATEPLELENALVLEAESAVGNTTQPYLFNNAQLAASNAIVETWRAFSPHAFERSAVMNAAVFIDQQRVAHLADLLAIYSGEELRGVASPQFVDGSALYFLTLHAEVEGEKLHFRFYDAQRNTIEPLYPGITFISDAQYGTFSQPVALSNQAAQNQPTWQVITGNFDRSMVLNGVVVIEGEASTHPATQVGAFVGGEVRGVASPTPAPETGSGKTQANSFFYELTIFANQEDEAIEIKVFDGSTDEVKDVQESFTFTSGLVLGTPETPISLTVESETATGNQPTSALDQPVTFHPIYPNPSASNAVISYTLSTPAQVTIIIYDLLGRQTATLVDAQQVAGHHDIKMLTSLLRSGLYVARLQTEQASYTRKFIVQH